MNPQSSLPPKPPANAANARGSIRPSEDSNALSAAHSRFARAAVGIYVATAAVSVGLLLFSLASDKTHDEDQTSAQLLLETNLLAHSLGQHLGLLVNELRRLSLRSEVDLHDHDLAPEKSLLQLSHERSTFFNLGVAILDKKGDVMWSEPEAFLRRGQSFAGERWFGAVSTSRAIRVVPVQPDRDSVLYVVSPLVKNQEFTGVLLGAVDLARGDSFRERPTSKATTLLVGRDGVVVYPPVPPPFSTEPAWKALFTKSLQEPLLTRTELQGKPTIIAAAPVSGTELVLISKATTESMFHDARLRLSTRLSTGLLLALIPALVLVVLLQRSLKVFRRSEEDAVRQERLRLLGEAANSIAHEVKNALNGLSMGLDLVVRPNNESRRERIVRELRLEIQRLSDFTTELMTFSRGVDPRIAKVDLGDFTAKVTTLLREASEELGAEIALVAPETPLYTSADGALLHAVISNLAANALDAATTGASTPRVEIRVGSSGRKAFVRVSDTGPGVSASMKPRLFEPFQSEKHNGVGIGLALARKIARAHGGDLVLDEKLPKNAEYPGASFVLTLPLLEEK